MSLPLDVLDCPICGQALIHQDDTLACKSPTCGHVYPTSRGVPILINEANSIFDISGFEAEEETFFRSNHPLHEWISEHLPDLSCNVSAQKNLATLAELLKARNRPVRVLVIGGGVVGAGLDQLLGDTSIEVIETDASWGPRTQIICDAHSLPFRGDAFDAVIVQAVLEHVVDPQCCVEEIYRVLRRDGLVYADTPFIQQVHGRQFDFTRFTRLGHRRLFRHFEEVESGVTCGPGMALAWTARYFMMSFFQSKRLRQAASLAARCSLFWLKYFDYYLVRRKASFDAASAFFFIGRKSESILSDRDLIADYQGGF
ncbi:class I SAM-dependent methyltransferase [Blastopirellula sp. J2-11]|uniref:class I SAM-dependent methyltransferase n=1 Tax=Blastopirellula sp. J2-11 TaxID=2943192 RepID=UPI0021C7BCBF|nr:class I SAM-dependent methyltransferase [Blastopirellula sp. J2-11]UUO08992.1 class I SAM-dependent methyltransferase [Blastopirellula sp. J2-11]